jgi:hypothetical protein
MTHGGHVCQSRSPYQFTGSRKTPPDTPFLSSSTITANLAAQSPEVHDARHIDWACAGLFRNHHKSLLTAWNASTCSISRGAGPRIRKSAMCPSRCHCARFPSKAQQVERLARNLATAGCAPLRIEALIHDHSAPVWATEPIPAIFHHRMMFGNHAPNLVRHSIKKRAIL